LNVYFIFCPFLNKQKLLTISIFGIYFIFCLSR
jgi:hypothetical protein